MESDAKAILMLPIEVGVRDPNYMIRYRSDDFGTHWLGYKDGDNFAPRPTSTEWIKIDGTYTALHRPLQISEKVQVGGNLTVRRWQ